VGDNHDAFLADVPDHFPFFAGKIAKNPLDHVLHVADAAADVNILEAFEDLFIVVQRHAQRPFRVDAQTANILDRAVDEFLVRQKQNVNINDVQRLRHLCFPEVFLNFQQLPRRFLERVLETLNFARNHVGAVKFIK